jgi:hypothetical protein
MVPARVLHEVPAGATPDANPGNPILTGKIAAQLVLRPARIVDRGPVLISGQMPSPACFSEAG